MNKGAFYKRMRQDVREIANGRTDSSAFLIWFLENFFRLDAQTSIDSVCDQPNDKGIDGIFVDDEEETIYLFQSKYSPDNDKKIGDNDLKNFVGASRWFDKEKSLQNLLSSTANRDLKSLINRLDIPNKLHYSMILCFVTNKIFNRHAKEYIQTVDNLEAYDVHDLLQKFTYFAEEEIKFPEMDLVLDNTSRIEYDLAEGVIARVYAVKAKELIKLQGIQDRTLFDKNVRYSVGNTRVNKSIKSTIADQRKHANFFLYHNGIEIVCEKLTEKLDQHKISLSGYAVINGCQSMLSFYEEKESLSNKLFVPVKIIQLNLSSPLVKEITYFANNQNAISLKDLKSNDPVQKSLQKEFDDLFEGKVFYRRKRGEEPTDDKTEHIIEKDLAAQIIMAVYLGKPHNTHLKQKLFSSEYTKIFSRHISAEKVYLGYLLYTVVVEKADLLEYEKLRNYGLARFFFSHVLSEIMRQDDLGKMILETPRKYVTTEKDVLYKTLERVWSLMTPDINMEIEDYVNENDGFFDYKNVFKNARFVTNLARKIKKDYIKQTRRRVEDSFSNLYTSFLQQNNNA